MIKEEIKLLRTFLDILRTFLIIFLEQVESESGTVKSVEFAQGGGCVRFSALVLS